MLLPRSRRGGENPDHDAVGQPGGWNVTRFWSCGFLCPDRPGGSPGTPLSLRTASRDRYSKVRKMAALEAHPGGWPRGGGRCPTAASLEAMRPGTWTVRTME